MYLDQQELVAALDDTPAAQEVAELRSRAWFEESDRWYASMAMQLGVSPSSLAPLTDSEYEEALYDEHQEKERERLVHYA